MGNVFRNRRTFLGGIGLGCAALACAACVGPGNGADGSSFGTPPPPTTAPPVTGGAIVVRVREVPDVGAVLTGPNGRTLYLFDRDRAGQSTCFGGCADDWPPLTTTAAPVAGEAVNPGLLGTSKRPDGSAQVVYNGHPVYYYIGDELPGQTTGGTVFSMGGTWYVLSPAGNPIAQPGVGE